MAKSKTTLLGAADKAADAAEATMGAAEEEEATQAEDAVLTADADRIKAQVAAVTVPPAPRRPAIYKRMEGEPGGQFAGMWIETQSNLLNVEVRVLGSLTFFADIVPVLCQYIRAWNIQGPYEVTTTRPAILSETQTVQGDDGETTPLVIVPERRVTEIEWRVLPSPMEAGSEVFDAIDAMTKTWIWNQVQNAPYKRDADSGK